MNKEPAVPSFASPFTQSVVCIQPDVDTSSPQTIANPSVETAVVAQSSALSAAEDPDSNNGDMLNPDSSREEQASGGKKVVRVVRRVVRRVIPAGADPQGEYAVLDATKADSGTKVVKPGNVDKDDISMGLTSLMGRSRTKEHRPRTRTQDHKEEVKEEVKQEEVENTEKQEKEQEDKKPAEVTSVNPTPAKSNTVAPLTPKPDPLAPPAGFIPAPKQNLLTPPPGFIPRRSSPVPPKQNPLARPPGFIPVTKTDPLAPPAGFIPKPRTVVVKKPEVLPSAGVWMEHANKSKGTTQLADTLINIYGVPSDTTRNLT